MTTHKHLKARIRSRMASTGERYVTARAHLLGPSPSDPQPTVDAGWALRGGVDPDAAALTNLLAHLGVMGPDGPLTEDVVFLATGGLGAGYILWEFESHAQPVLTLGFGYRWNYLADRLDRAAERLGLTVDWKRTGGAAGAEKALVDELDAGRPVVVWPDWYTIGYWRLPESMDGQGGHPVVAYARADGRVHLDDRNLSPLTVAADRLRDARARVGSYKNAAFAVRTTDTVLDAAVVRSAVRAGLADTVEHLGGSSTSFAAPAWRKWSRLLVDEKAAKGWPTVFADGAGLFGTLLSVWEDVEPFGREGGHLRELFADGLDSAAHLLDEPALAGEAPRWREIAERWHALAETAAPDAVPAFHRARELTASVTGAVAEGDDGRAEREAAATELWALRAEYAASPPLDAHAVHDVLAAMSAILAEIYAAESDAVARLRGVLG